MTVGAYKIIWTSVATRRNAQIEFFSILALQHAFTWTYGRNATQAKKREIGLSADNIQ